jgi:cbb3-type cytochrome oxidase subunit 3
MKKIILSIFIYSGIVLALSPNARAEVFSAHLSYNPSSKILSFDKASPEKISLNKEKFVSVFDFSDESNEGNYTAKLYDDKGEELISGNFKARPGAFILDIPYISIASSLKIFNKATERKILEADLLGFVSCNRNGICELEKGENISTCILDCASSNVNYSPQTEESLKANGGVIKDPKTGEIILKETPLPGNSDIPDNLNAPDQNTENMQNTENQNNNNKILSIILTVIISAFFLAAIYFVVRKKIRKQN